MRSPYSYLADLITRHPKIIAALLVCILLISMYGMTKVSMQTGMDTYIDKDTQKGALLKDYTNTFQSPLIMVIYETSNLLDPDTLKYIEFLQENVGRQQGIKNVFSVTDVIKIGNNGVLPGTAYEAEQALLRAAQSGLVDPDTIDKLTKSRMLTVGIAYEVEGLSDQAETDLLNNLQSLVAISDPPPGVSVTLSGDPAFNKEMGEDIGSETGILILAAMLLMTLTVGILFAHARYRLLPVGVVFCGLLTTFGTMGLAGISLSMIVMAAFPVLIGIGIDYAIQFHARLDDEARSNDTENAVRNTIERAGPSVLYAMIATSLGFIAMYITPIPMVRDFGLTCLIGVVACYTIALFSVPTFGMLVKYRAKPQNNQNFLNNVMARYDVALGRLALTIAKRPVIILLVLGMVAVVGLQLDAQVPVSTDEETFVPSDMPALINLKKVSRTIGSTDSLTVFVSGGDIYSSETMKWIDEFGASEVNRHDEILGVSSITTLIKTYNNGEIPQTTSQIKAVVDRIPESTSSSYINGNMRTVVQFSLADLSMEKSEALVDTVTKDLVWDYPPPGISASLTGSYDMFASLMDDIRNSKTQMTFMGLGLILVWLLFVYRRISAITPLIPIMMIVGWNGAIMFGIGIDYTPMTAVLGSMTIGVASEYTILIMERYMEERRAGKEKLDAIQTGVSKIGSAITVSGLTTVFGFSALTLSSFNILSNFGLVTVITVGFSLIGAIIVMPAVLSIMSGTEKKHLD